MLFLWMWEVNCLLIWISKQRNVDLDFYWSMIETKELYFKNSPLETHEIASKHVLYYYISPYNIPGLKASKLCCQCVDLLCQSYGNARFTNPKLWLCQSQIPFTVSSPDSYRTGGMPISVGLTSRSASGMSRGKMKP